MKPAKTQTTRRLYDAADHTQSAASRLVYSIDALKNAITEWQSEETDYDIIIAGEIALPSTDTIELPSRRRQLKISCLGKGRIFVEGSNNSGCSIFTLNGQGTHSLATDSYLVLEDMRIGFPGTNASYPGVLLNSKDGLQRVHMRGGQIYLSSSGAGLVSDAAGGSAFHQSIFESFVLQSGHFGNSDLSRCVFSNIEGGGNLTCGTGSSYLRFLGCRGATNITWSRSNFGGCIISNNIGTGTIDTSAQSSGTANLITNNNGFTINASGGDTTANNI